MDYLNIVVSTRVLGGSKSTEITSGRGFAPDPDPAGGAYSAPPDSLAGGEGLAALPQEPYPRLGPSGLALRPFGPHSSVPQS